MILSEMEIAEALVNQDETKRLIVTPLIDARHQFGPSSLDVRLGTDFATLETGKFSHINTKDTRDLLKYKLQRYVRKVRLQPTETFHLHPNDFALASTLEYVCLPSTLAARIEGRSSWGRIGLLVHATAGYIDPGFSGVITFELSNAGKVPIALKPGLRIGQICFMRMSSQSAVPYGQKARRKYQWATGVQGSRIYDDPEIG